MIKVVLKSLKILEIVSAGGQRAVKLSEIAEALGEKPSTCAGIVKTMTEAGYLQKDPVRGYHLGIMAAALTHGDLYSRGLLKAAQARLPAFAVEHAVHMSLSILRESVRHSVLEVDPDGSTVMQVTANAQVMNSATGLLLTSFQPRHVQDAIVECYGLPRRFNGYEDFIRYLQTIREQGYVELVRNSKMIAVAVPVYQDGVLAAALGAYMTEVQRAQWAAIQDFVEQLQPLSAQITADLEQEEPSK